MLAVAAVVLSGVALAGPPLASPAAADGPGSGTPWIVTLGDSYISGEAGRWAGNTNGSSADVDALGPTAYWDTPSGEAIVGCHRASSAEAFVGTQPAVNLACSGARTTTSAGSSFKPGLDFYSDTSGRQGQARALQQLAATRNVGMVVVSIGGNNFGFADIVQQCVTNFLLSPSWWPNYCNDDSSVRNRFTSSAVAARTAEIRTALANVQTAMSAAGYTPSQWTLLVQTYPSPLPPGSGIRYGQSGYTRQSTGGCGFWNADANWANSTALPTINGAVRSAAAAVGAAGNVRVLELQSALNGRRLCESTVGLLEERGVANWQATNAPDVTEWVAQIRTVSTVFGPYQVQESFHPNHWGQLALRNCVRQAWNGGTPRAGTCTIAGAGKNAQGEPRMTLS
jgi:hypothetical protein